jgi:hypothetical protein
VARPRPSLGRLVRRARPHAFRPTRTGSTNLWSLASRCRRTRTGVTVVAVVRHPWGLLRTRLARDPRSRKGSILANERDTPALAATSAWRQPRRSRTARKAEPTRMSCIQAMLMLVAYRRIVTGFTSLPKSRSSTAVTPTCLPAYRNSHVGATRAGARQEGRRRSRPSTPGARGEGPGKDRYNAPRFGASQRSASAIAHPLRRA